MRDDKGWEDKGLEDKGLEGKGLEVKGLDDKGVGNDDLYQGIVRSQDSTERSWFKVSRFCYM